MAGAFLLTIAMDVAGYFCPTPRKGKIRGSSEITGPPLADSEADFELAAAYTAGIIRNHPFVDGNKRTGHKQVATGTPLISPARRQAELKQLTN